MLKFYSIDQIHPFLEIQLDPKIHRTENIWHILIQNLPTAFDYTIYADGPHDPQQGLLFDAAAPLLDPFAHHINTPLKWGMETECPRTLKARYLEEDPFDWQGVVKPKLPLEDLIVYEMHVRGFTCDRSSQSSHPGTFLGIIDKIPYLKQLGINALELLPIYEFDETSYHVQDPTTGKKLLNYWGYSTLHFFCPMKRFAASAHPGASKQEFQTLVRELHKAGIEVILDVVYNHTAEGNQAGPTFSFKGLDNPEYYLLTPQGEFKNYSGTGNTFFCNSQIGQTLILDSLRYWAEEMQVDGFRFDLASIMTRGSNGAPLDPAPLFLAIERDPLLKDLKMIAEPWDAGGLYQLGQFPKWGPWLEWNGYFRDTVRRFIKGTDGQAGAFATVLSGSENLYGSHLLGPCHSVNFITCHDGYTLYDLVSYQDKHNLRNGEDNRDGANQNDSWNCGYEGPSNSQKISALRKKQMRNFTLALLLASGVPMLLMGDEYGHTHKGNNNTWCQDNELNWFLWDQKEQAKDFLHFVQMVIAFRKKHHILRRTTFLNSEEVCWHGTTPFKPDWGARSRFVAYTLKGDIGQRDLFIAFNAGYKPRHIMLPPVPRGKKWQRVIDTAQPSPLDFLETPAPLSQASYDMSSYSSIVLEAF